MSCLVCGKKLSYGAILQGNYKIINGVIHSVHEKCLNEVIK